MRPQDWDGLTIEQEDHLLDWVEQYIAKIEEARAKR